MYLEKSLYLITLTYCGVFPVVLKQFLKLDNDWIVTIDVMKIGLKNILMFQ